jgi:hypothetical protein
MPHRRALGAIRADLGFDRLDRASVPESGNTL